MRKIVPKSFASSSNVVVDVAIDEIWKDLNFDANELAQKIVLLTLSATEFNQSAEVSIVLTNDETIRKLNKQYRGKDKATNVLSFPMGDGTLGDIVIAYETMNAEAAAMEIAVQDHFTHLLIHGILHLLGYDHEEENQALIMENLEISILSGLGIENPYSRPNFLA